MPSLEKSIPADAFGLSFLDGFDQLKLSADVAPPATRRLAIQLIPANRLECLTAEPTGTRYNALWPTIASRLDVLAVYRVRGPREARST